MKQLEKFITTETEMQAFLNLPPTLFKMKSTKIYTYITEEKAEVTKPVEVFLANIPDFKNPQQFQGFITELNQWMDTNHTNK